MPKFRYIPGRSAHVKWGSEVCYSHNSQRTTPHTIQCMAPVSEVCGPCWIDIFIAYRLVALDKCPGVKPVGIGELMRRIAGKVILSVTGKALQKVTRAYKCALGSREDVKRQ